MCFTMIKRCSAFLFCHYCSESHSITDTPSFPLYRSATRLHSHKARRLCDLRIQNKTWILPTTHQGMINIQFIWNISAEITFQRADASFLGKIWGGRVITAQKNALKTTYMAQETQETLLYIKKHEDICGAATFNLYVVHKIRLLFFDSWVLLHGRRTMMLWCKQSHMHRFIS